MGLTKVSYAMINGAPVNVLDYGAVGDGVTDDTAAIQNALDTGKLVFIPKGKYKTTATLIVPSGGGIQGEGHSNWDYRFTEGTWITSSASPAIQVGTAADFTVASTLDSFSLNKTGFTNGGTTSNTGILYLNSYYTSSKDIYIEGFDVGLQLGNDAIAGTTNLGMTFINTNIGGCNTCILANNAADISFYGGRLGINGSDAARERSILIEHNVNSFSAYRLIMANNSGLNRNVQIAVATVGLYWITFDNCDMETATIASVGIQSNANASFVRIKNCWIGSPAPVNVSTGNDRVLIEQNTFPVYINGNAVNVNGGNITVKNNDFVGSAAGAAISIGLAVNVKIIENYINGTYPIGISLNPLSASSCGSVIIANNHVNNVSSHAINVETSSGMSSVTISENQLNNFAAYGVRVAVGSGQTTPTKSHLTIDGNVCVSASAGGITIVDTGLDYYMIVNNDISGCSTKITNGSTGTHNVVANNLS